MHWIVIASKPCGPGIRLADIIRETELVAGVGRPPSGGISYRSNSIDLASFVLTPNKHVKLPEPERDRGADCTVRYYHVAHTFRSRRLAQPYFGEIQQ